MWIADETVTGWPHGPWLRVPARIDAPRHGHDGQGPHGRRGARGCADPLEGRLEAIGKRRWMTSSTYRGHPLAVAAMSTVVKVIDRDGLVDRAAAPGSDTRPGARVDRRLAPLRARRDRRGPELAHQSGRARPVAGRGRLERRRAAHGDDHGRARGDSRSGSPDPRVERGSAVDRPAAGDLRGRSRDRARGARQRLAVGDRMLETAGVLLERSGTIGGEGMGAGRGERLVKPRHRARARSGSSR